MEKLLMADASKTMRSAAGEADKPPVTSLAKRGRPGRKPATKGAQSSPNPAFAWLLAFMKRRPAAAYSDAAAAAKQAGHSLYPITWGRAQLLLGRVKAKSGGRGGRPKAAAPMKRGPGRPRKSLSGRGPGRPPGSRTGAASIAVAEGDVTRMQAFVAALNSGRKANLRYDGRGWELTAG
jgi:hypothetical protein